MTVIRANDYPSFRTSVAINDARWVNPLDPEAAARWSGKTLQVRKFVDHARGVREVIASVPVDRVLDVLLADPETAAVVFERAFIAYGKTLTADARA